MTCPPMGRRCALPSSSAQAIREPDHSPHLDPLMQSVSGSPSQSKAAVGDAPGAGRHQRPAPPDPPQLTVRRRPRASDPAREAAKWLLDAPRDHRSPRGHLARQPRNMICGIVPWARFHAGIPGRQRATSLPRYRGVRQAGGKSARSRLVVRRTTDVRSPERRRSSTLRGPLAPGAVPERELRLSDSARQAGTRSRTR